MSRKTWFVVIAIPVVMALVAGTWAAYHFFREYRSQRHLTLAESAATAGRWADAKREYSYYLSKKRGDLEVMAKYAKAAEKVSSNRRGAIREAGSALFQIAREIPKDRTAARTALDFYKAHGSWAELLYASEFFAPQWPDDAQFLYFRAIALDQLMRKDEALDAYSVYIAKGADMVDAYGNLARLQKAKGLPEQAADTLEQARKRFPGNPKLNVEVAKYALLDGQVAMAQTEIDNALKVAPEDGDVLVMAAQLAAKGGRWDDARQLAEKALTADPARGEAYLLAAQAEERQNKPEAAVEVLSKVPLSVQMDNPDLFYALAEQQLTLKKYDEAHKTMEAYRRCYPDAVMVIEYLNAREMLAKGDLQNAVQKLSAVSKGLPEFSPAQYYLAIAYMESNQKDLARATIESFIQGHPNDERMKLLRDSLFSENAPDQDPASNAQALLNQANPNAQSLLLTADRLMRSAKADPQVIRNLLETCIRQEPSSFGAYLMLVEHLIRGGDLAAVKETVQKAEQGKVPAGKVALMRAALAFAEKAPDKAFNEFTALLALPDTTAEEVTRWATFFADRGGLEAGLTILEAGLKRFEKEGRQELEVQRVSLCVQQRDNARALDLLKKVSPDLEKVSPELAKQLNTERMRIADVLLGSTNPDEHAQGEALMAEVAQKDPGNADVRLMRANLCLRKDPPDYAGAEKLCQEILNAAPKDVNALLLLAELVGAQGQYARALEVAQRAVQGSPQEQRVQMAQARALMNLQRNQEAVAVLEPVLAAHPGDREVMELLVRAFAASGQLSQAENMLETLRKTAGKDEAQLKQLGGLLVWLQLYRGRFEEVEKAVRGQYEADPKNSAAAQTLASALIGQKRLDEAEKVLSTNAELNPSNSERWTALARFYLSRNDRSFIAPASTALTRALVVTPNYAPALREQIQLQARTGNTGVALQLCDRYLSFQPSDVEVLYQKALLLARDPAQKEEALRVLGSVIALEERPAFFSLHGSLCLELKKYREAVADFQKLSSTQGVASAQLDAAMAEAQLGLKEYELAKTFLESAKQKAAKGENVDAARLQRVEKGLQEAQKP